MTHTCLHPESIQRFNGTIHRVRISARSLEFIFIFSFKCLTCLATYHKPFQGGYMLLFCASQLYWNMIWLKKSPNGFVIFLNSVIIALAKPRGWSFTPVVRVRSAHYREGVPHGDHAVCPRRRLPRRHASPTQTARRRTCTARDTDRWRVTVCVCRRAWRSASTDMSLCVNRRVILSQLTCLTVLIDMMLSVNWHVTMC